MGILNFFGKKIAIGMMIGFTLLPASAMAKQKDIMYTGTGTESSLLVREAKSNVIKTALSKTVNAVIKANLFGGQEYKLADQLVEEFIREEARLAAKIIVYMQVLVPKNLSKRKQVTIMLKGRTFE